MKKYFTIFTALLLFSSCIKVENTNLCPNPPLAPVLASKNIQVGPQDTLNLSVMSPNASLTYLWLAPTFQIQGASVSLTPIGGISYYGSWSVIAQKGSCNSDTTYFIVSPAANACGLGIDSFTFSGSTPVKFTLTSSQNSIYNDYYLITFADPSGNDMYIYVPAKPGQNTVTEYSATTNYFTNLNPNQCYIYYNAGSSFTSYSGSVFLSTGSSAAINISFCNVEFINGYSGQYIAGSGNFVGN